VEVLSSGFLKADMVSGMRALLMTGNYQVVIFLAFHYSEKNLSGVEFKEQGISPC
jgi:hypothetical protein